MKLRLAEITARYVGAPYKLGGWSREEGFDCVSLICTLGKEWGVPIPESFQGLTEKSYTRLWTGNRVVAQRTMLAFVESLGEPVEPLSARAGDLLILKTVPPTIGIHAGNDLVLSAFTDVGVDLARLQAYEILKAVRWVHREK